MTAEREVTDEAIAQAEKEMAAERKIISILKKIPDPVKRARVLRAVAALYGFDEG